MREIKVGQVWSSKFGPKRNKSLIKITKQLNTRCWEIEMGNTSKIINTDELIKDYNFQKEAENE